MVITLSISSDYYVYNMFDSSLFAQLDPMRNNNNMIKFPDSDPFIVTETADCNTLLPPASQLCHGRLHDWNWSFT